MKHSELPLAIAEKLEPAPDGAPRHNHPSIGGLWVYDSYARGSDGSVGHYVPRQFHMSWGDAGALIESLWQLKEWNIAVDHRNGGIDCIIETQEESFGSFGDTGPKAITLATAKALEIIQ